MSAPLRTAERIVFRDDPVPQAEPALEVAFIGHCPGPARWQALRDDPQRATIMRAAGCGADLDRLIRLAPRDDSPDTAALRALYRMPVPVHSLGEFEALFPQASRRPLRHASPLSGGRAWLPQAVRDFFVDDDQPPVPRRLWILRVPETEGSAAFRPDPDPRLPAERAGAWERALRLPRLGLLALPDLERLLLPSASEWLPPAPPPAPVADFLPCDTRATGPKPAPDETSPRPAEPPPPLAPLLAEMLGCLARRRPDLQLLLTLPPAQRDDGPGPAPAALDALERLRSGDAPDPLHRLQPLFPPLRRADGRLVSASGLVAGRIAVVTHRAGPWRSVAGQPLPGALAPAIALPPATVRSLRERPGMGVLYRRQGQLWLDDERLPAPVLAGTGSGLRSGEVARLLGWLRRALEAAGEALVFEDDSAADRLRPALNGLLGELYRRGALRGRRPEDAWRLSRLAAPAGVILFEIELAPAWPVDRLVVRLRREAAGGWHLEARYG